MRATRERTPFGERIYKARTHAKLTQPQLAKAVGMAQSTLGELEYIGNGSSFTTQIALACGVRPEWLAEGAGAMVGTGQLSPDVAEVAAAIDELPERLREWVLNVTRRSIELARQGAEVTGFAVAEKDMSLDTAHVRKVKHGG